MTDKDKESESEMAQVLSELKQIRVMFAEAREQQARYLWILFPIGAILLVQTILFATKL